MADIKISALTAATTPLAGTEVLPIVQSGSTKKVSVADLTAGRAVATAGGSFTDNLTQGTAAKGVDFSANTGAAGKTSTLLNWYEEGTWTPTQGANLTVVGSFSSSGKYTKVGRLVTVNAILSGSTSIAWGTGSAEICLGLPFTASNIGTGIAINNAYSLGAAILAGATGIYSGEAMPATAFVQFSVSYTV